MGGQTIRQLEELLRHGNPEEVEYQNNMVGKFLHYTKVATTIWCHLLQHSVHHIMVHMRQTY